MSDFGDFEADDAWATEPPDPEQVARRLHLLRRREGFEERDWDALTETARGRRIALIVVLLDWLRRQGALR